MNPPKVLLISSNRWNSAITEYLVSTQNALKLSGYRTHILCLDKGAAFERISSLGIDYDTFTDFKFQKLLQLEKMIHKLNPDIIMTFGGPETTLTNTLPLPNIRRFRFRGQDFKNNWFFRTAQEWSHHKLEGIITPADWLTEKLKKTTKIPCHTVRLGIDSKKFSISEDVSVKPHLTLLGRFDPVKGHQVFFRTFAQFLKRFENNQTKPILNIIGREENISTAQLREWAMEQGISESVMICDQTVDNIEKTLGETTLAIISSLDSEVICRSAQEFLCTGCPVFVSGVGSLEECLAEKTFGSSYRGLNDNEIVDLLYKVFSDAASETNDQREIRSENATKHFSFETMGKNLNNVFTH